MYTNLISGSDLLPMSLYNRTTSEDTINIIRLIQIVIGYCTPPNMVTSVHTTQERMPYIYNGEPLKPWMQTYTSKKDNTMHMHT